ncbi:MAG TPA: proton-conducting transporter membrane subunit, partial [Gammaproteobacteria bacterium]
MTWFALPPGLILSAGGIALPFFGYNGRRAIVLGFPILTLLAVWSVPDGAALTARFMEYEIVLAEGDRLARLFGTIFAIMAAAGGLFALGNARTVELCASMIYAGASIGVIFAGDLLTLFVFWELMAIGSTLVLWSAGTLSAYRASMRYLSIHLLGGVVLMGGIVAWTVATGDIAFGRMTEALSEGGLKATGAALILAGFLLNAGAPPFSAWLPDAYPEASPSGMVTLSAFTTKTAIFVLIVGFAGTQLLVWVGLYMVFYGIVYALLENDMRRILAYSIVNQVGFMV